MKRIIKGFMGIFLAFVLIFSTATVGVMAATKEVEIEEGLRESMVTNAIQIVQEMASLDETTMEGLLKQNTPFLNSVVDAWKTNQDKLGTLVETRDEEVIFDGTTYTITMLAEFEEHDAQITLLVDSNYTPTTLSLNIQYPLSYVLGQAGVNTAIGIATVFSILILLSGLIYLLKYVNVSPKKKEEIPAIVDQEIMEEVEEELVDDLELVAVITAAIAASQNQSSDSFVVRSIKKANNRKWQKA